MTQLTCAVVGDLLPLYAEELVCAETRGFVDDHLTRCPACRAKLEGLKQTPPGVVEDHLQQAAPLKRVYRHLIALIATFPLWFPLLIAAAAVVLSLLVSLWAAVLSLWSLPLALGACAIGIPVLLALGISANCGAVTALGCTLMCAGLAVLSGWGCWWLSKRSVRLCRWLWRKLRGLIRGRKEAF